MSRYGGPYGNGYGTNEREEYRQDYSSSPERPRDKRAGGYGGFIDNSNSRSRYDREEVRVNRPTSLERRQAKRRSGGSGSSRSRSRGAGGRRGDGGRQIEEVLQTIQQDWPFMTRNESIPVRIALQLMDPSSLGLANRLDEFLDTHDQLQSALKAIVNEHHQGFNSSIGTFHKIQASIQTSQQRVRTLRDNLVIAKANLSTTKPELKGFAQASQGYEDMLSVLSTIEQLQLVPEKLEARISEKRFLSAVEVLQEAQKSINRSEMENVGALSDLRVYLSNQEHVSAGYQRGNLAKLTNLVVDRHFDRRAPFASLFEISLL